MRYEFTVANRLSDMAAAAFPELERTSAPAGGRLLGAIRDQAHLDEVLRRFADLGLKLVDVHRLPD